MLREHRRKFAAVFAASALAVGGGAALAATQSSPQQQSQAIVDDAAAQLGVTSTQLTAALKKALENQVDAALSAGQITQTQADQLKSEIESGRLPLLGIGRGPGPGREHGPDLATAASYLGVTAAELQSSLAGGKTLADVAKAEGKSVDGLVAALVASAKSRLDDDVSSGRLTPAQRQAILADLEERMAALVNGALPQRPAFRVAPSAATTTA